MRLHVLERELAAAGFTLARITKHRIYRHAQTGRVLTIAARPTKTFCRAELCAIRRDVRRLLREGEGNDAA
jgi:predicted RNA binding protein YcfA (HicA-like mRNA interferase family)